MQHLGKDSCCGMVLIFTLIMMQLLILLGLYLLSASSTELKLSNQYWQKYQLMTTAEYLLDSIEKDLETSNLAIAKQGIFHLYSYSYRIEELGIDPCALISATEVAEYLQITLSISTKQGLETVLQSTLIKPIRALDLCKKTTHSVIMGPQGWIIVIR